MNTPSITPIPVPFNWNNQQDTLWPVIIQQADRMVLVDTGYEGFLPLIIEAARKENISLENLTDIIVTHHDIDHMGALAEWAAAFPRVRIHASPIEATYISGTVKSARLIQAESLYPSLPDEQKPFAKAFQEQLEKVKTVPVDHLLPEGNIGWLPGLSVIATPGHTPGHISIYDSTQQILITADALVIEGGHLNLANPHFAIDLKQAVQSAWQLSRLPVRQIICYHGGVMSANIGSEWALVLTKYAEFLPSSPEY